MPLWSSNLLGEVFENELNHLCVPLCICRLSRHFMRGQRLVAEAVQVEQQAFCAHCNIIMGHALFALRCITTYCEYCRTGDIPARKKLRNMRYRLLRVQDKLESFADILNWAEGLRLPDDLQHLEEKKMYVVPLEYTRSDVEGIVLTGGRHVYWIKQLVENAHKFAFVVHLDGKHKLHMGKWMLLTLGTHSLEISNDDNVCIVVAAFKSITSHSMRIISHCQEVDMHCF